jgi:hypothetical protein
MIVFVFISYFNGRLLAKVRNRYSKAQKMRFRNQLIEEERITNRCSCPPGLSSRKRCVVVARAGA